MGQRDRKLRSFHVALLICIAAGWIAYVFFGHEFLRSIYEGRSIWLFDRFLLRARAQYPLEAYFDAFDFRINFIATLSVIILFSLIYADFRGKPGTRLSQVSREFFPFIMTAMICIIAWLFYHVTYQTVDDAYHPLLFKNMYWQGYNVNDGYALSFLHPALSWILSRLYAVFPDFYWYELTLWAANFLSCMALILTGMQNLNGKKLLLVMLIGMFYFLPVFVKLQFSISATLAGGAGALLLCNTVLNGAVRVETHKMRLLSGLLLITLGCLIRFEASVLSIVFVSAAFLPFGGLPSSFKGTTITRFSVLGIAAGIVIILILAKPVILSESMEQFWNANSHRVHIGEYNDNLPEEVRANVREKTGWTANDYLLIEPPILIDSERFGYRQLNTAYEVIRNWRENNPLGLVQMKWKNVFDGIADEHLLYFLVIISLISLIYTGWRKRAKVLFLILCLFALFILVGIYFKPVPYRVYWGLFTISSFIALAFANKESFVLKNGYLQGLLIALCALIVYQGGTMLQTEDRREEVLHQQVIEDVTNMMTSASPEMLAIRGAFCGECYYKPFAQDPFPEFSKLPVARLNLRAISPLSRDYLMQMSGHGGPEFLCSQNKNIVLITQKENLGRFETELEEHFGIRASFTDVFNGTTFSAFRCRIR